MAGATNTIVCNSVLFDRRNKKVISGRECMALQGYPEGLLDAGSKFSNSQLTELAGNAYNAFSFSNILLSMLATVPIDLSGASYVDHPDWASRNMLFHHPSLRLSSLLFRASPHSGSGRLDTLCRPAWLFIADLVAGLRVAHWCSLLMRFSLPAGSQHRLHGAGSGYEG